MDLDFDDSSDDLPTTSNVHDLADFLRTTGPPAKNAGHPMKPPPAVEETKKPIDRNASFRKPAKGLPPTSIPPRSHAPVIRKPADNPPRKRYDSFEMDPEVLQNTQYNARLNLDFVKPTETKKPSDAKVKFANFVEQVEFDYASVSEESFPNDSSTSPSHDFENSEARATTLSGTTTGHMGTQTDTAPDNLSKLMEEQKQKFDKLSSAAYKKIKNLLTEKQIMELEIKSLRAQLERTELRFNDWLAQQETTN